MGDGMLNVESNNSFMGLSSSHYLSYVIQPEIKNEKKFNCNNVIENNEFTYILF